MSAAEQHRPDATQPPSGELLGRGAPDGTDTGLGTVGLSSSRRLRTFDSLIDVPAYRWYMTSMMGHWSAQQMQQVVRGYLAFVITGSFAALGGVALANAIPRLVFALAGGVVADRQSRRRVLQLGQGANAVITAVVAVLLFRDELTIQHLFIAAALQGSVMSFSMPARQAMIPEIVGPERLTNAFALNASGMNTMRLLAPAAAGFIIALAGAAWAYVLMTCLFLLGVLAMFRVPSAPLSSTTAAATADAGGRRGGTRGGLNDLAEGFRYLGRNQILLMLLAVHLFVVILTLTFQRLAPGFVSEVLATDDEQAAWRLGVILTTMGGGALLGSLVIASLPARRRGRLLLLSITVFAAALLAFAISESFWLSIPIVFILGIGQAGRQSLNQVLIQSRVDNEYRGRISSIMMMEMGLESVGTFGIALVAAAWGAQVAFGSVAMALFLVVIFVMVFMPSYRRLD